LDMNSDYNDKKCIDNSRIHNLNVLWENTWYNLYDKWIELHFKYWKQEDIDYLVNRLEFKN
jgi:hypothetical protein